MRLGRNIARAVLQYYRYKKCIPHHLPLSIRGKRKQALMRYAQKYTSYVKLRSATSDEENEDLDDIEKIAFIITGADDIETYTEDDKNNNIYGLMDNAIWCSKHTKAFQDRLNHLQSVNQLMVILRANLFRKKTRGRFPFRHIYIGREHRRAHSEPPSAYRSLSGTSSRKLTNSKSRVVKFPNTTTENERSWDYNMKTAATRTAWAPQTLIKRMKSRSDTLIPYQATSKSRLSVMDLNSMTIGSVSDGTLSTTYESKASIKIPQRRKSGGRYIPARISKLYLEI